MRVLVVEDYEDGAESLALLLRFYGHEVEVARDGATAIRKAQEKLPNVLLMDIGLPGEDGYAVARRLRPLFAAKPLLVALTGYASDAYRRRSRDEGFDHHLIKPAEPDELLRLLHDHARRAARRGATLDGWAVPRLAAPGASCSLSIL